MTYDDAVANDLPGDAAERGQFVAPLALVVITAGALAIYQWVQWPHHWQSRLMHPILFSAWTFAWHATVHGRLLRRWPRPVCWWLAVLMPLLAAGAGEWMQSWWRAVGHDPEWSGAAFSLLGVGLGWWAVAMRSRRRRVGAERLFR